MSLFAINMKHCNCPVQKWTVTLCILTLLHVYVYAHHGLRECHVVRQIRADAVESVSYLEHHEPGLVGTREDEHRAVSARSVGFIVLYAIYVRTDPVLGEVSAPVLHVIQGYEGIQRRFHTFVPDRCRQLINQRLVAGLQVIF